MASLFFPTSWKSLCLAAVALILAGAGMACSTPDEEAATAPASPVPEDADVEEIGSDFEFTEGPYWRDEGYLVFSDIPANTIYRWDEDEGESVYIEPSGHSNGITADSEGRLLLAQHDGRIARIDDEGNETILADEYEGQRLNSPNDLVVHSDGSIYFTDPPYGVEDDERELDFSGIYRLEPDGEPELLTDEYDFPNGLAFSPDEATLYVNDSEATAIWAYDVGEDGTLSNGQPFAEPSDPEAEGTTDGMKVDTDGNLYTTGPGGVWIYTPEGELLDRIDVPIPPTNLAFGGGNDGTLYITARESVYRIELDATGIR